MAEALKDASVMIVAGSIEYERVPGRLSSLEPILCQEGEFLAKQVELSSTLLYSFILSVNDTFRNRLPNFFRCHV